MVVRKGENYEPHNETDEKLQRVCDPSRGRHLLGPGLADAEDEEGRYAPVANVSTIIEAKELAAQDSRRRRERLERDEDPGLCPHSYKLWARGIDGEFRVACEIE